MLYPRFIGVQLRGRELEISYSVYEDGEWFDWEFSDVTERRKIMPTFTAEDRKVIDAAVASAEGWNPGVSERALRGMG